MAKEQLERFVARIHFLYQGEDDTQGGAISYIYNRESLDKLGIERQAYDRSQFIEVGDTIKLGGHKCKVVSINFKLEEKMVKMDGDYGYNAYSPTEPTDYNCQVNVFVEEVE